MHKSLSAIILAVLCWSGSATAQYNLDEISSPFLGGPGNYVYPVVCTQCTVWQDYQNFAWNQLSINGGFARTPNNPNHETAFRIYTHPTDDLYATMVEFEREIEPILILGEVVGQRMADGDHFIVEIHPDNGDRGVTNSFPADMGTLPVPSVPAQDQDEGDNSGGSGGGTSSGSGGSSSGGGDSSGFGSSGFGGGGFGGGGFGGGGFGGGGFGGGGGGSYCGHGTDYICIQY